MCQYMDVENNKCNKAGIKCSFINQYSGPKIFKGSEHCGLANVSVAESEPAKRIVYEYNNYC